MTFVSRQYPGVAKGLSRVFLIRPFLQCMAPRQPPPTPPQHPSILIPPSPLQYHSHGTPQPDEKDCQCHMTWHLYYYLAFKL